MRLPLLSYRALLILYGASVLVLLPFGAAYAYARLHGANRTASLMVCLILGVAAALSLWAWLEPRLISPRAPKMNFERSAKVNVQPTANGPQILGFEGRGHIAAVGKLFSSVVSSAGASGQKGFAVSAAPSLKVAVIITGQRVNETGGGTSGNIVRAA